MKIPERLSIRLASLREPLARRLAKLRKTPSEYIRSLVAADLGIPVPVVREGRKPVCVTGISAKQVKYKVGAK